MYYTEKINLLEKQEFVLLFLCDCFIYFIRRPKNYLEAIFLAFAATKKCCTQRIFVFNNELGFLFFFSKYESSPIEISKRYIRLKVETRFYKGPI